MSKKKVEKKITFYEPTFKDVLVCKNADDNAYLEIFYEKPENVSLDSLGSLLGIFEITDNSEDSSYIPNYLISIIKKEFYSKSKRGSIESFEMALHKANVALSQLASEGNINWIGKLNAVCAVIEKNNFHFAQTGEISVLLVRSKSLTNLSEDETVLADPNPLKTFRDVLSGRLERDDKVIMTTNATFQIFSVEELKNAALKFSQEDFIQFLKTALINQLDRAAVLVTNIEEQEKEIIDTVRRPMKLNAFSQEAYTKNEKNEDSSPSKEEEKNKLIEEIKKNYEKTKGEFVDEKTGHIYIREDILGEQQESKVFDNIKSYARSLAVGKENGLEQKNISSPQREKITLATSDKSAIASPSDFLETPINRKPGFSKVASEKMGKFISTLKINLPKLYFFLINFTKYRIARPLSSLFKKTGEKISSIKNSRTQVTPVRDVYANQAPLSSTTGFLPNLSKIKIIFSKLDKKKKIIAVFVLALIVIVPYFISKTLTKMEEDKKPIVVETPPPEIPLKDDKNVVRIEEMHEKYQGSNIIGIINVSGSFLGVTQENLISISDSNSYPLPENFKNPDLFFEMDDLSLIFILKDKKLTSFSPNAKKFLNNNISIPNNAKVTAAGTFLTYVYLLDSQGNQIYRYPRIEGGFGQKTDWIKDQVDLSSGKSIAINESVFVSDGDNIQKFLKGKKQDYSFGNTATPIIPEKLYAKPTSENLYVLDKSNSRIIKINKDGNIVSQFYNSEIEKANDFAVNEESNEIYISSENKVSNFKMN